MAMHVPTRAIDVMSLNSNCTLFQVHTHTKPQTTACHTWRLFCTMSLSNVV